ncbi:monovalent cation/H+ antiporter complex subunit F [Rehaibacterium terrae]|uniref:monovalent cation/H+ antiporter complex subunit F n=1 Tax=Rehaibacterium terrae TaxID=1341696 RepID=UPI00391C028F
MESLLPVAIAFLALNLAAGLVRVVRGPRAADRMLAVLLFGSTTVAILLLMAAWLDVPALRDVALLLVLLATILSVAFVGLPGRRGGRDG